MLLRQAGGFPEWIWGLTVSPREPSVNADHCPARDLMCVGSGTGLEEEDMMPLNVPTYV